MSIRYSIQAEAREWKGTPFRLHARAKGLGVDCAQLIIAVGEACDVLSMSEDDWRWFKDYNRLPNPRMMVEALSAFMVRIQATERRPGDVVLIEWRESLPMHLAILTEYEGRELIVHALEEAHTRHGGKVVEHGFVAEWPGRAHSFWRYPGLLH